MQTPQRRQHPLLDGILGHFPAIQGDLFLDSLAFFSTVYKNPRLSYHSPSDASVTAVFRALFSQHSAFRRELPAKKQGRGQHLCGLLLERQPRLGDHDAARGRVPLAHPPRQLVNPCARTEKSRRAMRHEAREG
eukprot:160916-Pleurochrysis_carterae.AAC.1